MNQATSAVLASNNPSPINAIPTTSSFGSASSSSFFSSRFSGSIAFYCLETKSYKKEREQKEKKNIKIETHKKSCT